MISLNRIVVTTDLSPLSECAVAAACELAAKFDAELTILHVVVYPIAQFVEQCQVDYGINIADCERQMNEVALTALGHMPTAPITDATKVKRAIRMGFAVPEILSFVKTTNADLLVTGTHGRSGLAHVLMGSVADLLVRSSACPVLTVRDPEHKFVSL